MTQERILITGAAGNVADMLRHRLACPGRILRLLDINEPTALAKNEEQVIASINDDEAMAQACEGVSAVVHLGGKSVEATIDDVLKLNVHGTYVTLEAARRAGVPRVILASSNHAVGFTPDEDAPDSGLPADTPPRPDTLYGMSKVAVEAAGRLYGDRYNMDIPCLRIGTWAADPNDERSLATWLSPDDGARLIEACLSTESPGFRLVWGISRNTRRWFSLAEGEEIGYYPQDDSEAYASATLLAQPAPAAAARVGGPWCEVELGLPM